MNSGSSIVKSESSSLAEVMCDDTHTSCYPDVMEPANSEGCVVKCEPESSAEIEEEVELGEGYCTDGNANIEPERAPYSKNVDLETETHHKILSHPKPMTKRKSPPTDEILIHRFACPECPYTCAHRRNLSCHLRSHTGEKPYSCAHCAYVCSHTQSLKRHMRNHSGEKPFACPKCAHRFAHKQTLRTHLRIHTGEKPFSCPLCHYSCAQQQNLKSHMFKHTGERPFRCTRCPYAGTRKENLKIHMFSHSRDKPFSCSECFYECTQKRHFIVHMRTHSA